MRFQRDTSGGNQNEAAARPSIGPTGVRGSNPAAGRGMYSSGQSITREGRSTRRMKISGWNPATGAYIQPYETETRKKRPWLWAAGALLAAVLVFFALTKSNPADIAKIHGPDVQALAAVTLTSKPTDAGVNQSAALTPNPVQTPKPTHTPVLTLAVNTAATPTPSPTSTPVPDYDTLKQGMHGDAVKNMQNTLITLGYLAQGKADGDFGKTTKVALESFQRSNGLKSDGIAGSKTLVALYGTDAKKDPDVFVWVSGGGKKYHSDPNCSGMKNAYQIKLSEAEKKGRGKCKKCH